MLRRFPQIRRGLSGLLIAGLIGIVAGLPGTSAACNPTGSSLLPVQIEEPADGESNGIAPSGSDLFAPIANVDTLAPAVSYDRFIDNVLAAESTLADTHRQRGPPAARLIP
jgi:hypothetical protein